MTEPGIRYGVIRPAPDLPPGYLPPDLEGLWLEIDPLRVDNHRIPEGDQPYGTAHRTNRTETRDDGERAYVYEVRP